MESGEEGEQGETGKDDVVKDANGRMFWMSDVRKWWGQYFDVYLNVKDVKATNIFAVCGDAHVPVKEERIAAGITKE